MDWSTVLRRIDDRLQPYDVGDAIGHLEDLMDDLQSRLDALKEDLDDPRDD